MGNEHLAVAKSLLGLGTHLHWCERNAEAEPPLREALAIYHKRKGDEYPLVAEVLEILSQISADQGEFVGAERLMRKCVVIRRKVFTDERVDLAHAVFSLGKLTFHNGKLDEAEKLLREAIEKYNVAHRNRGDNNATANCHAHLGRCLTEMGRYDEAEQELLEAHRILLGRPNRANGVVQRLIALYDAWDKPDEADRYREKLASKTPALQFDVPE